MKNKIATIGLMMGGVMVGLLLCEMVVRVFIIPSPPSSLPHDSPWCFHKTFGWALVPKQRV